MEWLSWVFLKYAYHLEMLLRLGVATISGMAIGLNRDINDKPIGMRTLGLVSLGSAVVVLSGSAYDDLHFAQDAASRVIQGILTGLGFLGAGAILRAKDRMEVHGLTTASTVWIAAALGVTAGLGAWFITITGTVVTLALLVLGKPLEQKLTRLFSDGGSRETND